MSQKPDTPAHASAVRRDARHIADDKVSQRGRRHGRARWCRGKPGVEHQPACMTYAQAKTGSGLAASPTTADWRILVCKACGKELKHWFPIVGSTKPKPDWVTD